MPESDVEPETEVAPLAGAELARVRSLGLFAALSAAAQTALLAEAVVITVPALHTLYHQDQPGSGLMVVLEGVVGLLARVGSQGSCLVDVLGPGQLLGEAGLFDGCLQAMTAQAITETRLALIPVVAIHQGFQREPLLRRHMLAFLSLRLRQLLRQITQLKLMTAPQRLGSFLLGLIGRHTGRQTISLPCELQVIAAMLGMSPESLSRSFQQLQPVGVTRHGPRGIVVDNPAQLRDFIQQ